MTLTKEGRDAIAEMLLDFIEFNNEGHLEYITATGSQKTPIGKYIRADRVREAIERNLIDDNGKKFLCEELGL